MYPIDSLVGNSGQQVQRTALCGEEEDEGHLNQGDPGSPKADIIDEV
jgi:hypothetical protein